MQHKEWSPGPTTKQHKYGFGDRVGRAERPTEKALAGHSPPTTNLGESLGPTSYSQHKEWTSTLKENKHYLGRKVGREEVPTSKANPYCPPTSSSGEHLGPTN